MRRQAWRLSKLLSLALFLLLFVGFRSSSNMSHPDTQRSSLSDGKEQPPFYEQGKQVAPRVDEIDQSAGVKRIAAINDNLTSGLRWWMFFGGE